MCITTVVMCLVGMKFIPLRTPGGELIPGSGLFVRIKKKTIAAQVETNDGNGVCDVSLSSTHQIDCRQVSNYLEDGFTDDSKDDTKDSEGTLQDGSCVSESAESHDQFAVEVGKNAADVEECQNMYYRPRRFSSSALLQCTQGVLSFKESQQLTAIAEVYTEDGVNS